mmetsp:Transcript_100675/g.259985  ORF Transcript_100675/g.259985 Transcript_100675/m.259985 type:complete len:100 (-) Transcript_100675:63-362(-)
MFRHLLLFLIPVLMQASPPGSWEPLDADMDIMALIDDEPEGIAFVQKDARLQDSSSSPCPAGLACAGIEVEPPQPEGVHLLQVRARYKLKQPVKKGGGP